MSYLRFSVDSVPPSARVIRRERWMANLSLLIERWVLPCLLGGSVLIAASKPFLINAGIEVWLRAVILVLASIGMILLLVAVIAIPFFALMLIAGLFACDSASYVNDLCDAQPAQIANLAQYLGYIEITTYMSRVAALGRPLVVGEANMLERVAVWDLPRKEREARFRLRESGYLRLIAERTGLQCAAESSPAVIPSAN